MSAPRRDRSEPLLDRHTTADVLADLVERNGVAPTGPTVALVEVSGLDVWPPGDDEAADVRSVQRCLLNALESEEWLGRFGGDELVVVSSSARDEVGARDLVARLRAAVRRSFPIGTDQPHVSVSVGAACATGRSSSESLLRTAAQALIGGDGAFARRDGVVLLDDGSGTGGLPAATVLDLEPPSRPAVLPEGHVPLTCGDGCAHRPASGPRRRPTVIDLTEVRRRTP